VLFVVNGAPPSTGGVFFVLKLFTFINYLVTIIDYNNFVIIIIILIFVL
jgi:hypothetical protein